LVSAHWNQSVQLNLQRERVGATNVSQSRFGAGGVSQLLALEARRRLETDEWLQGLNKSPSPNAA
jgi:hypothetical protein